MTLPKAGSVTILLAALFLWGCSLQTTTEVSPDGSGSFVTEVGLTAQDLQLLESFEPGSTSEGDVCQQLFEGEFEGYSLQRETRGDELWCIVERPFADLDGLRRAYEASDVSVSQLRIEDERFHYEIVLDLSAGGLNVGEGEALVPLVTWRLVAPGPIEESNADRVEGRTLTWELEPGRQETLRAVTATGSEFPWLWVGAVLALCTVVLLSVGLVAGVVLLARWRKRVNAS